MGLNKISVITFLAGSAAAYVVNQFVKSGTAHKVAVKTVATGMKVKDNTNATIDTIKEDAKDLYAEAKATNGK